MSLVFEVYEGGAWLDKTAKLSGLRWSVSGHELENLRFTLFGDDLGVGQRVRLRRGSETAFEGIVYQADRRHESGRVKVIEATAYTDLISWDRHIVYREYTTGTRAGTIVKDLASLESGTDTTNVDENNTPALTAPWHLENVNALKVMLDISKSTNYYIRMKPGKRLFFKPKQTGTPRLTLDSSKTASAEYSEDRWMLKNRVIYVGDKGRVLADVSEGAGDLPIVIHDPFLTDEAEAQRRANTRLALCKEYGRRLRVRIRGNVFENSAPEPFDTVRINLPNLNLTNTDMFITGISYEPASMQYDLEIGGQLEYLEDFLQEALNGDVAARFGQAVKVPEIVSTLSTTTEMLGEGLRIIGAARYPVYINRPPLTLYNPQNIILDNNGRATLASGATSGSFEVRVLPESPLFTTFIKCDWIAEKGSGGVSAKVLNTTGDEIMHVNDAADTQTLFTPRWPRGHGWITHRAASKWGAAGASVSDFHGGIVNTYCIRFTPSTQGSDGEIFYPSTKNLGLKLDFAKYVRLYFYGDYIDDFSVKIRLHQDNTNHLEGALTVKHDTWAKYELILPTFRRVGTPSTVNWLSIVSPRNLLIDSDYVLLALVREALRLRFELSRPSPSNTSPKIKEVRIVWREGDYG